MRQLCIQSLGESITDGLGGGFGGLAKFEVVTTERNQEKHAIQIHLLTYYRLLFGGEGWEEREVEIVKG